MLNLNTLRPNTIVKYVGNFAQKKDTFRKDIDYFNNRFKVIDILRNNTFRVTSKYGDYTYWTISEAQNMNNEWEIAEDSIKIILDDGLFTI